MLMRSRPWADIAAFYRSCEEANTFFTPMARLVDHIESRPYASLLFATKSMHTLIVAQHAEIDQNHDALRIELDDGGKVARFAYHGRRFDQPATWECEAEKIIETFEGFLRKILWLA